MPPIILVGLIISALYLLFNNDEETEKSPRKAESDEKNETVLAHDVSSRRRVRRPRLERKPKSNGVVSNRTRVATTYSDMNDELVNDEPATPRQAESGERNE